MRGAPLSVGDGDAAAPGGPLASEHVTSGAPEDAPAQTASRAYRPTAGISGPHAPLVATPDGPGPALAAEQPVAGPDTAVDPTDGAPRGAAAFPPPPTAPQVGGSLPAEQPVAPPDTVGTSGGVVAPAPPHAGPAPGGADPEDAVPAAPGRGGPRLILTDRVVGIAAADVVVRPPSLVVGVGASRGVGVDEVYGLVRDVLRDAGLSVLSVVGLATVDAKADEPGIVGAAGRLGVPVRTYPADVLAAITVPNPSGAPLAAVGTPSVAEAAALAAGRGGELLVAKRKSSPEGRAAMATCAVVRRPPRGRLAVVGLGPGARDLLTPRATAELRRASVLVGLDQYVDQIRDLLRPGTRVIESGLGREEERARTAVTEAQAGHAVALVGSGDAGVYAMASPALAEAADDIEVVGVPGVTAALAAAAILGAPLGHDHVSISLSDLHTPWEVIERRVRAAAEADIVVTFYNPRSRGRDWQLPKALALLAEHRTAATPVGVVRNASRPDGTSHLTTLARLDPTTVDMMTVVTVGNTATREIAGRMVTPRGYRWQSEGAR
ncbi:precorrin-3B C(17)-methyltransferase [Streptomyces niveus]|uniref:precorrin-3B C(17)-methyltransferase n=1 Tax=Streptomyces niveus TaxID=193462 RepID=UPI0036D24C7E